MYVKRVVIIGNQTMIVKTKVKNVLLVVQKKFKALKAIKT